MAMKTAGIAKDTRWKLLMQSLYYPAVLGTCFVLLLNKLIIYRSIMTVLADVTVYAGLLLTFYFTISYLINNEVEAGVYGAGAFTIDLIEIVLIFLAFSALGYLDPQRPDAVHLHRYYSYIAAIPILEQLWNRFAGIRNAKLWWVAGCASGLSIFGAIAAYYKPQWTIVNELLLLMFFLLIILYLLVLMTVKRHKSHGV